MTEFIPHQSSDASVATDQENDIAEQPVDNEDSNLNKQNEDDNRDQDDLVRYEDIVETLFASFKDSFQKNYKSSHEHEKRKNIFRHNMRYVHFVRTKYHLKKMKLFVFDLRNHELVDSTETTSKWYKGFLGHFMLKTG